ncbi:cytochrome P450 26B1-like [Branchiostoma floridae]|uniref:Cytochrome P450 26B1-like n=1 Tax=Branchiostoma floridae TaxID=7739 RepID=A0A9J7KYK8_BRAFL|nr:cytochrome P450 26B1-like [Branchiostoma floridae]
MLEEVVGYLVFPAFLMVLSWKLWGRYATPSDPACALPLPAGTTGFPIIGETLSFILEGADFSRKRHALYGDIFKTHILGRPTIRVRGADNVRKILRGENDIVGTMWPDNFRMVLGTENLAMCGSGPLHRQRKKIVMRAFRHDALEIYTDSMQAMIADTLRGWCRGPQPLAVYPAAREMMFRLAIAVLVGFHQDEEEARRVGSLFRTAVKNIFSLPLNVPGSALRKALQCRQEIDEWLKRHIHEKHAQIWSGEVPDDVLSFIISSAKEEGKAVDQQQLLDTAVELLFAGHETTSSAATSLIMHLALQPQVVQKVQEDLEKHGLLQPDQPLSLEQVGRLTYVGQVVKEVLRISPPIGGGFRKALKTFAIGGFQVPEGWAVMYSIRDTHSASQLFSSPQQFDPDRWAAADSTAIRYDFLPFGAGPRACAGKEFAKLQLKLLCVELVRSCRWELADGKVPEMKSVPVLHPANGLPVNLVSLDDVTVKREDADGLAAPAHAPLMNTDLVTRSDPCLTLDKNGNLYPTSEQNSPDTVTVVGPDLSNIV